MIFMLTDVTSAINFDYTHGSHGPAHWGTLKPEWIACKNGTRQSPISVKENIISVEKYPHALDVAYKSGPLVATISHNGHTPVVSTIITKLVPLHNYVECFLYRLLINNKSWVLPHVSHLMLETSKIPRANYISTSKKMNEEAPYGTHRNEIDSIIETSCNCVSLWKFLSQFCHNIKPF